MEFDSFALKMSNSLNRGFDPLFHDISIVFLFSDNKHFTYTFSQRSNDGNWNFQEKHEGDSQNFQKWEPAIWILAKKNWQIETIFETLLICQNEQTFANAAQKKKNRNIENVNQKLDYFFNVSLLVSFFLLHILVRKILGPF